VSPRDWDAPAYDRVAGAVQEWGHALVARLELRGDETVLDAGCGSGRVTEALAGRLPRGRVVAVDGSPDMVARAREHLARRANVEVRHMDLLALELADPVDVVFSSAVFHWIPDHPLLFARLHDALRPGGRLLAQCGGEGNVAEVLETLSEVSREQPFAEHLAGWPGPWNFTSQERARSQLEAAGFGEVKSEVHVEMVQPDDPATFLRTMVLGSHMERLPEPLHEPFLARVAERLGSPLSLRYVRLTLAARRCAPGSSA
jgi:trans-aconitate 2-methyltransferase